MEFSFKNFDFNLMKEMTLFSSFLFLNLLIDQINWNVDKFILGRIHGTISVAIYGLAAQLNAYYLSIGSTISSVFIPRVHRLVSTTNDNAELSILFTKIGRVQFIVLSLVASGLFFFGQPFINMWAGNDYSETYPIVLLLILPVTIPLIQNIGLEIQRAKNMHQFRSWVYLFIALANLAITIPLAQNYGGIGAAIGTALSLIIGNGFIMNWYNHVKVGLDMKTFWKQILSFIPALIVPSLIGVLLLRFVNLFNIYNLIGGGLLYVLVFSLSMWFLGMNEFEKDFLGNPFRNLLMKLRRL